MADETPVTLELKLPAKRAVGDPDELLARLEKAVNDQAKKGSTTKWWIAAGVSLVVVVAGVAWYWVRLRDGRELARLRHEKEKQRILADRAAVEAKVARSREEVARLDKEIAAAHDHLRRIEADIRLKESHYEASRQAIDRIRSWGDLATGVDSGSRR